MKKILAILLSSLAVSQAALIHFDLQPANTNGAGLLPSGENPPVVDSTGSGGEISGGITFDTDTGVLNLAVGYGTAAGFTDLLSPLTDVHIHGPAGIGTNASVLVPLLSKHFRAANPLSGGVVVGSVVFPPAQVSNLLAGLMYMNIHTTNHPGGEIRGQLIAVVPPNVPPSLVCPETDEPIECGKRSNFSAVVTDEDGDAITVIWAVDGVNRQTNTIPAGTAPTGALFKFGAKFSAGTHTLTVTAIDGATNTTSCSSTVTVVDTKGPAIAAWAKPGFLCPPNHQLVPVEIKAIVRDNCSTSNTWRIVSVTVKGGGTNDFQITGDHTLLLRADKGKSYCIRVEAVDDEGNSTTTNVIVCVTNDRGHGNDKDDDHGPGKDKDKDDNHGPGKDKDKDDNHGPGKDKDKDKDKDKGKK